MSDRPAAGPRVYRPKPSPWWWAKRRPYLLFFLRELSSVFVAWFVVFWILLVRAVARGPEEYQAFLEWSAAPGVVLLNVVALLFLIYHSATWFNLAPAAMVVRVRGTRVPAPLIAGGHYALWAVLSAFTVWLFLAGW